MFRRGTSIFIRPAYIKREIPDTLAMNGTTVVHRPGSRRGRFCIRGSWRRC